MSVEHVRNSMALDANADSAFRNNMIPTAIVDRAWLVTAQDVVVECADQVLASVLRKRMPMKSGKLEEKVAQLIQQRSIFRTKRRMTGSRKADSHWIPELKSKLD